MTRACSALERAPARSRTRSSRSSLYVALMWLWHVPALYDAALESRLVHVLEHVCFLSVGLLYWWHLLSPIRSRLRRPAWARSSTCSSTKLAVGLLGIGLTFAPDALYDFYDSAPASGASRRPRTRPPPARSWPSSSRSSWASRWPSCRPRARGAERDEQRAERYA